MSHSRQWDPPSPHLTELLKQGVFMLMGDAEELLAAIDAGTFEVNRELLELAPQLRDPLRAAARSNVMVWATSNMRNPGMPVPANLSPENIGFAREVIRHGFDETILSGFRVGQNLALQAVTEGMFRVTDDHQVLRALLRVVSQSIYAYVEDTLEALTATIRAERAQLRDATSAARAEAVALILEGAPISEGRASQLLSRDIGRPHTAAIVWSEHESESGSLETAANALARAPGSPRPLILPVGSSTLWVWVSGTQSSELAALLREPSDAQAVRIAIGRPGSGIAGFRRSHQEAAATQRLARRLPFQHNVVLYDEVEVVALASADEDQAREFVGRTLGRMASAPVEIRETLRTYLRQECSLTRTAEAEFAHRNTVAARLDRVRDLLPRELTGHTLEIGLALEIARVIGPVRARPGAT